MNGEGSWFSVPGATTGTSREEIINPLEGEVRIYNTFIDCMLPYITPKEFCVYLVGRYIQLPSLFSSTRNGYDLEFWEELKHH